MNREVWLGLFNENFFNYILLSEYYEMELEVSKLQVYNMNLL